MRTHLLAVMLPGLALAAAQTPALLVGKTGEAREIQLIEAGKDSFRYRTAAGPKETVEGRIPDDGTIHVFEPDEFSAAMDLYQGRKYQEAKAGFIAVKKRFAAIQSLEDSPASMAAFYEMECLRKLGDLDGLATALQNFSKGNLTRETQLRQLELYVLWDAVRTRSWERLDALAKERVNVRMPGDQRAQVAYCHGLALEGLNRPKEALFAYQTAVTADSGASEEVARPAALRILAIHKADRGVQTAMRYWGAKNENKNSKGFSDLAEAVGVARMFEMSLGAGTPLPAEFRVFLKFAK